MAVYSFTYFVNSLGFFTNKRNSKMLKFVVLALLIFISGTRYYMGGSDVYVYEGVYNGVPSVKAVLTYLFTGVNNGVNTNYETGFLLLCAVVKAFHFSYFGFILIWTILFYYLMVRGLRDFVPSWAAYFAVFMYKIMFYDTFISIRQGLTIAMFCYMLRFIRDKKWYIYFPLCFLAYFEHNGAIILFPLYFINQIPMSKRFIRNYALILAPTWLISSRVDLSGVITSVAEFIGNTHSSEHWAESTVKISMIHTLECYVMVFAVLFFYEKIVSNKRRKEAQLVLRLFLLTIPLFTLFRDWIILTREKDYFVLMYGIILGFILEGRTTFSLEDDSGGYRVSDYRRDITGAHNWAMLSLVVIAACFIGMMRYVLVFDGGTLKEFTSFLFVEGVHIFE